MFGTDTGVSSGVATVGGTGSTFNLTDSLYLGGNDGGQVGSGTLNVDAGGTVNVGDTLKLWSSGTVNLNGGTIDTHTFQANSGSTFNFNNGTLRVDGGSLTTTSTNFVIEGTEQSTLELIGGTTTFPQDVTIAGNTDKRGTLLIAGATVNANRFTIGNSSGAVGTVSISDGGTVTLGFLLDVAGGHGHGILNVTGGSSLSANIGYLGTASSGEADVLISGSNSLLEIRSWAKLGENGCASTVTVEDSGKLKVGDALTVYDTGVVELDGGTVEVGSLTVDEIGDFHWTAGTLKVTNSTFVIDTWPDAGAPFGGSLTLDAGKALQVPNNTILLGLIQAGTLSIVDGGTASAHATSIGSELGTAALVTVSGSGSSLTSTGHIRIGEGGQGELHVESAGAVSAPVVGIAWLGSATNSSATVSGSDSVLTATNSLYLGGSDMSAGSSGTLAVHSGGAVNVTNTLKVWETGTMTVNTAGTVNVTGTLAVRTGGTVNLAGGTIRTGVLDNAGTFSWTSGTLHLTNSGLTLDPGGNPFGDSLTIGAGKTLTTTQDLIVGENGSATMIISGGGTVASQNARLGHNSAAVGGVIMSGGGSNWNVAGDLYVADAGKAYLNIASGAVVSSNRGFVGAANTYANNNAYVSGTDSRWNVADDLQVGGVYGASPTAGYGRLWIMDGGTIAGGDDFFLGCGDASSATGGAVTVDGGGARLTVADDAFLGYLNAVGFLTVNAGGVVDVGDTLNVQTGAVYLNGGTLRARVVDLFTNGSLYVYSGTLEYTDDLSVSAGDDLQRILGTSHPVGFGQHLKVNGTTTLNNPLSIDGGTFSTGSLVNPGMLQFASGTFNLTGANLTVGGGGLFGSQLAISSTKTVNVTGATTVDAGARLLVQNGAFSSGTLANNGEIRMEGAASTLTAGSLANNGLIAGSGEVYGPLTNNAAGLVSVATAERLTVHGGGSANDGQLEMVGGTLKFTGDLANHDEGLIIGNGSLIVEGGLFNAGTAAFTATSNVRGDVTVDTFGLIISSGGTTTFYDDVVNNGEIRTSLHSFSVFLGSVSGSAAFTGPGTVLWEGDVQPGNSPFTVSVEGDLVLGDGATLEIELGGLTPGTGYDQVDVTRTLSLDGTLDVRLIDGFLPAPGDSFDILDWGRLASGTAFDDVNLPTLAGLGWDDSKLYSTGVLTARISGDANCDDVVDNRDASILGAHWLKRGGATWGDGDFNRDGNVNDADAAILAAHWHVGLDETALTVPEPSTLALLALGAVVLLARVKKPLRVTTRRAGRIAARR